MSTDQSVIEKRRGQQRGSALGVTLIFLVLLTLLGLTAMHDTGLQERMAGNARDKNISLQAGEAMLRDAEEFLESPVLPAFNGAMAGLIGFDRDAVSDDFWSDDNYDWPANSIAYDGPDIDGTVSTPRYVIEELPASPAPGTSLAADAAVTDSGAYRITVRAEGGTSDAVSILQTIYRR